MRDVAPRGFIFLVAPTTASAAPNLPYREPYGASRAKRGTPARPRAAGLVMTDYLMLAVLFAAAFWVLDPLRLGLDRIGVVKHLPLMGVAGVAVMAAVGRILFAPPRRAARAPDMPTGRDVMLQFWPLALFAGGVLAGSLYGRFAHGVDNSFLNMGLFVWVVPILAWVVCKSADPARWARGFFIALGSVAVVVGLLQWKHFGNAIYYHGIEFAVIPLAVYCWYAGKSWPARLLGWTFFLSLAVAQHKNTGYMLALFVLAYAAYWAWRAGYRAARDAMARERQVGWAAFLVIGALAFGGGFYGLRKLFLPSGNPDYRLHTYQKALEKFADSPLIGNLFTGPATERFELYQVNVSSSNVLPTHSDPLDILGNGGLLYALLFVWGCFMLLRLMMAALEEGGVLAQRVRASAGRRRPREAALAELRDADSQAALSLACMPALHGCVAIFISGLIVLCFNPVLTQPNSALTYWAATGIGLGLALRMRARPAAAHSPGAAVPEARSRTVRGPDPVSFDPQPAMRGFQTPPRGAGER